MSKRRVVLCVDSVLIALIASCSSCGRVVSWEPLSAPWLTFPSYHLPVFYLF